MWTVYISTDRTRYDCKAAAVFFGFIFQRPCYMMLQHIGVPVRERVIFHPTSTCVQFNCVVPQTIMVYKYTSRNRGPILDGSLSRGVFVYLDDRLPHVVVAVISKETNPRFRLLNPRYQDDLILFVSRFRHGRPPHEHEHDEFGSGKRFRGSPPTWT